MNGPIQFDIANGVGTILINRPEAHNAMNWQAQAEFSEAVTTAIAHRDLRVLIITGAGNKTFVSGGDIKELAALHDVKTARRLAGEMGRALEQLTQMKAPVVAAVNGDAIGGGCEIITACDLRMSSKDALFRFAQVRVGLTPGWGGSARLVHLLGAGRAAELMLTGRVFTAQEANEMGLVHRLVAADTLMSEAGEWAEEMIRLPGEALAATKRLTWDTAGMPLSEAYRLETEHFVRLWPTPDHVEAMTAFIEKRRPRFLAD